MKFKVRMGVVILLFATILIQNSFAAGVTVTTGPATSITEDSAVLEGDLCLEGSPSCNAFFEYGLTTDYNYSTDKIPVPLGSAGYSTAIAALLPGMAYHYRSIVSDDETGEINYGADRIFTTLGTPILTPTITPPPSPNLTPTLTIPTIPIGSKPTVTSGTVSQISTNSATISGVLSSTGGERCFVAFEYGPTLSYGQTTESQTVDAPGSFSISIGDLQPETTYHWRITARNSYGAVFGNDQCFSTQVAGSAPMIMTGSISGITTDSAVIEGSLLSTGGQTCYIWAQFGPTNSYGMQTTTSIASGPASVTFPISGLSPGSNYHYRVIAGNNFGISYGADRTFTTSSLSTPTPTLTPTSIQTLLPTIPIGSKPTVASGTASGISTNTATLSGEISSTGGERCFVAFEYGPTLSYGQTTESQIVGGPSSFSVSIGDLQPETTYHWRITAKNSYGAVCGNDQAFETCSTNNEDKNAKILSMVNKYRKNIPTELVLAIIRQESGSGTFTNPKWIQPSNGDGIMQVTFASGHHENSGKYSNDEIGYDHAIKDGCEYLNELFKTPTNQETLIGAYVQCGIKYNSGPNTLYIYLGKNWGDKNYSGKISSHLENFIPSIYGEQLHNPALANGFNRGQQILNSYLYKMNIASQKESGYYRNYQKNLDNNLRTI